MISRTSEVLSAVRPFGKRVASMAEGKRTGSSGVNHTC